jgi:hypothetical protein
MADHAVTCCRAVKEINMDQRCTTSHHVGGLSYHGGVDWLCGLTGGARQPLGESTAI